MSEKNIDLLSEDPELGGQKWCCVSFISKDNIKGATLNALKIRGSFSTREEAEQRAKDLAKIDPNFNVYVGEVGKWLPWEQNPSEVENNVYQEEELNKLMKGYKENLDNVKMAELQRKLGLMGETKTKEARNKETSREKLRKKLDEKKKNAPSPAPSVSRINLPQTPPQPSQSTPSQFENKTILEKIEEIKKMRE